MQFCFVQTVRKLASKCSDSQIIIQFGYHWNSNIIPLLLNQVDAKSKNSSLAPSNATVGYLQWIFVVVIMIAVWFYDMDRLNDVKQQTTTFGQILVMQKQKEGNNI